MEDLRQFSANLRQIASHPATTCRVCGAVIPLLRPIHPESEQVHGAEDNTPAGNTEKNRLHVAGTTLVAKIGNEREVVGSMGSRFGCAALDIATKVAPTVMGLAHSPYRDQGRSYGHGPCPVSMLWERALAARACQILINATFNRSSIRAL
jgi:hypothetical protein